MVGSIWRKLDLHFHTPSSYDYKDKSTADQESIDGLVSRGIEVAAVTDHHVIDTYSEQPDPSLAGARHKSNLSLTFNRHADLSRNL